MEAQRDQTSADSAVDFKDISAASKSEGENRSIQNMSLKEAWGAKRSIAVAGRSQYKSSGRRPWVEALVAFADDVSVVGLRYVANPTASAYRRCIWIVLILAGAAFTTYQIQNRIRYYAKYPVNVIIRVEHMEEMRFPTVTICNENRVSLERLTMLGKHQLSDFSK